MSHKICLIDGSGYIFRAFYGLPPLTAPDGTPVNAVYGFTNMFLKLTSKIPCEYCLVLFDAKRQNFRNDIFPDYKGTRKEIPEDLIPQFSIIREAVEALNLNHLEMEGYEADDLIATYANMALAQGLEVVIVSGDKDLMQLIRPGVEFYDPMKDKFFSPEDVKEKFGVYPEQVVDVQALAGDTTDNIPGIPGIGLKTAAQLVNDFGSLEGVLTKAGEIKQNKRRETILANIENARISLQLVTLRGDVPVDHRIAEYKCLPPEMAKLDRFIETYGFRSIRPRLEKWVLERCNKIVCQDSENTVFKSPEAENENSVFKSSENAVFKQPEKSYELIQTEAKLKYWVDLIYKSRVCSIAAAYNGPDPVFDNIVGLAVAVNPGKAAYIPFAHGAEHDNMDLFAENRSVSQLSEETLKRYLKPLLSDKSVLKIGHNIKTSMHFIAKFLGTGTDFFPLEDIAVLSYDLDSSEHGHSLDELCGLFLDVTPQKFEELTGTGKNKIPFDKVGIEQAMDYMAARADYALRLYHILKPRLIAEQKVGVYENFDRPLLKTLYAMEERGIMVNAKALQELSIYFDSEIRQIEARIFELAGEEFNVGSPKQIGEILFDRQGLKGKKTPTGAWQTGADILEQLAEQGIELAQRILDWREFSKLKSTYSDALFALLDKDNRIHTTYNQFVANTGRLASNNPNLQNIPIRSEQGKKIRACFIAKPGHKIISSDYSQVELRLLASVADVKNLKKAFADGIDIHSATASHVFGVPVDKVDANLRRHAKAINFGIVYGISQYGLAKNIGVSSDEAKAYIDAYFAQMPEIKQYMEKTIAFARKHGYVLTPFGRKCSVLGINDKNKRLAANAERAAINAPIQGGAADIIKLAMNKVEFELARQGYKTKMLLQVHDELVFEAPDDEVEAVSRLVKEIMENVVDYEVPFTAEVGVGTNWAEAH